MSSSVVPARSPCLDEEVVLELIAGNVSGAALGRAEQHLATCDACTELVARMIPALARDDTSLPTQIGKPDAGQPHAAPARAADAPKKAARDEDDDAEGPDAADRKIATADRGGRRAAESLEPAQNPSLRPGTILRDTYRIVRHIEKGGMGEVYEASHARLSGRYAVKVLPPEFAAHKTMLSRFRREAQIASGLQHPNIVQVIDFHETSEGRPYLVMEYLDGENLAKLLARHGPFTLVEALPIVQQIAAALGAVHRQGIVHRDIKPQNVFIVPQQDGTRLVKLLDFGISKGNVVSSVVTRQPALMGTPQYMAPEQALRRTDDIGPATDQFALGAMVYEMLTGRPAFEGPLISVVLYQIVHEKTAPMSQDGSFDLVEPVLQRALAKTPGERFASMTEFAAALTAVASGASAPMMNALGAPTRSRPFEEHHSIAPLSGTTPVPAPPRSRLTIAALVAAGAAAAGLLFFAMRWFSPAATGETTVAGRSAGPPPSVSASQPPSPSVPRAATETATPPTPPLAASPSVASVLVPAAERTETGKRPAAIRRANAGPRTPRPVPPLATGTDRSASGTPTTTSQPPAPPVETAPAPNPPAPSQAPPSRLVEEL